MAISKNWMEMTPKKESPILRLKCYLCKEETEVFSDEAYKIRKCSSCKENIDPSRCEVIQVH
jgi:ribosomal protein S27E